MSLRCRTTQEKCVIENSYNRHMYQSLCDDFSNKFGNGLMAKFVLSYGRDPETNTMDVSSYAGANRLYSLITAKFNSKGFSKEEACEYMIKNKEFFRLGIEYITGLLSILSIINLDNEAFFEHSDFIAAHYSLEHVYAVVSILKVKPYKCTMEDVKIMLYLKNNESYETDKPLSNSRKESLKRSYVKDIINEKNNNKESCKTL